MRKYRWKKGILNTKSLKRRCENIVANIVAKKNVFVEKVDFAFASKQKNLDPRKYSRLTATSSKKKNASTHKFILSVCFVLLAHA